MQYNIQINSKWEHKDGGFYYVLDLQDVNTLQIVIYCKDLNDEQRLYNIENKIPLFFARDLYQFKKNFKEIK